MRWNWRLLIPVGMLLLAGMACDPMPDPEVVRVEADPEVPGTAYVLVEDTIYHEDFYPIAVYETHDYGATWVPSGYTFSDTVESETYDIDYTDNDELIIDGSVIWSLARLDYRVLVFSESTGRYLRNSRLDYSISPADPDVIYIALGREGVLVGPAPGTSQDRPWQLRHNGIEGLHPSELALSNLSELTSIIPVAFLLLFLPAAVIHDGIVTYIWDFFAVGERRSTERRRAHLFLIGFACLTASAAAIIWLTDETTSLNGVLVAVTVIGIIATSSTTIWVAEQHHSDRDNRRKAILSTGAITPIVPLLVAISWWIVLPLATVGLVISFFLYVRKRRMQKHIT